MITKKPERQLKKKKSYTLCLLIQPCHCWVYNPKEIIRKKTCTKIFIAALFVAAKKLEDEGIFQLNWGMTEQIVVYAGDGIVPSWKEQWNGEILCELEKSPGTDAEGKEQNRENTVYRDWYTVVKSNIMDSPLVAAMQRFRAMLMDNWKREQLPTYRGRTVGAVTQKKNNYLNPRFDEVTIGDIKTDQPV